MSFSGAALFTMRSDRSKFMDMPPQELSAHRLLGVFQRPQYVAFQSESKPLHSHESIVPTDLVLFVRIGGIFA